MNTLITILCLMVQTIVLGGIFFVCVAVIVTDFKNQFTNLDRKVQDHLDRDDEPIRKINDYKIK